MSHDCQCAAPGFCQLLKKQMGPRMHAICQRNAEGLTPEQCDVYRGHWLAKAHPELFERPTPNPSPAPLDCPHRGDEVRRQACHTCTGQVLLKIQACGLHGECTLSDKPAAGVRNCGTCPDRPALLRWVTTAELVADTYTLASRLPANVAGIIGVSRSGLTPASLLAQHLHLPLWILRQDTTPAQRDQWEGHGDIVPAGNGWRIHGRPDRPGPLLVVDDTMMTGRSVRRARELVKRELPGRDVLFAAIYRNPGLPESKVDYFSVALPQPHFLEWNLFNSIHLPGMAVDFDGILTRDGTTEPQYLCRKGSIPLIVTGRKEKHRAGSLAWLAHWGVQVDHLVMLPNDADTKAPMVYSRHKAEHFTRSGLTWFVESCPIQAKEISELTSKPVICPAAGKVFQ